MILFWLIGARGTLVSRGVIDGHRNQTDKSLRQDSKRGHQGINLDRIAIDPERVANEFHVEENANKLGGVSVLRGKGTVVDASGWENILYGNQAPSFHTLDITAIPYYAWDNRAPGEMRIWMRARGA